MNLIVQGIEVRNHDLKQVAKLAAAARIERVTDQAFRLADARTRTGVAEYCGAAELDHAFIDRPQRLADLGLVVMDMDSTLITIECIDEIADIAGLKTEVAAITAQAMRGELADYAESLRRRVALLAGIEESALQRVYDERLRLSPGGERMLAAMRGAGVKTMLVSGGFTFFTERLQKRLGLDYVLSNTLGISGGKLTGEVVGDIVDADRKRGGLVRVRDTLGLERDQVLALGDGANDLEFMREAGTSIAYHAKPVVRQQATYALDFVGLDGVLNLFD